MVQGTRSSVFSRSIVNLFAGMVSGSPELPSTFHEAGYVCHSIELSFLTESNDLVRPEIILCSDNDGHTLIVEAKSGANLNPDQLRRYANITPACLETRAFIPSESAKKHDVLFVGTSEWKARLLIGSALLPSPRRVMAISDVPLPADRPMVAADALQPAGELETVGGIERIENAFSTDRMNSAFGPVLPVNWDLIPIHFLPVDHESASWEFAQFVMPEVIRAILEGQETLSLTALAETFITHWKIISSQYQSTLLIQIRKVLKEASQKRFSQYLVCGSKGVPGNEAWIKQPPDRALRQASLRTHLKNKYREFMDDLNSPQIAILYED